MNVKLRLITVCIISLSCLPSKTFGQVNLDSVQYEKLQSYFFDLDLDSTIDFTTNKLRADSNGIFTDARKVTYLTIFDSIKLPDFGFLDYSPFRLSSSSLKPIHCDSVKLFLTANNSAFSRKSHSRSVDISYYHIIELTYYFTSSIAAINYRIKLDSALKVDFEDIQNYQTIDNFGNCSNIFELGIKQSLDNNLKSKQVELQFEEYFKELGIFTVDLIYVRNTFEKE